jgi:1-phosphatidylinositol phosphodiesterase
MGVFGACMTALVVFARLNEFPILGPIDHDHTSAMKHEEAWPGLAEAALAKVLQDASPIFGHYSNEQTKLSTWMSEYADDTKLVHMNIPGTHDTATWNYSHATQQSLVSVTKLVSDIEIDNNAYRCQDSSIVHMLNSGIRVFDLRYAHDVTKSALTFWHGPALQSQTATVDDVLFGFYKWLDDHPTEALFLSFQYEPNAEMKNSDNANVQRQLYAALTSPAAQQYVDQRRGILGTLGEARGKITLLRRFDLNDLPQSYGRTIPGIHFSPSAWQVNGDNISLTYNLTTGDTAYIQDYYKPTTSWNSSVVETVNAKLHAVTQHFQRAADTLPDSLFWGFASSTKLNNVPPITPRMQALGNGSVTPDGGVNQQLIPLLESLRGKRLGIVMFDFYEEPSDLLSLFLSLLPPKP